MKTKLLLLGARGRLGKLLRASLTDHAQLLYSSRQPPADVILGAEGPLPSLPCSDVIVALWGVTSNTPDAEVLNPVLAERSRAVALACGAQLVLHLSSAAVYGPGTDMQESAPLRPTGPYGASKLRMEQVVGRFDDTSLRHICLRLANVVGADSLAPALQAADQVTLDRFPDGGGPERSYVAPGDLAQIILALSALPRNDLPTVLNVASPAPVSMEALARAAGCDVRWVDAPPHAVQHVSLNTDLMRRLLPDIPLRMSAEEMIADWQAVRRRG